MDTSVGQRVNRLNRNLVVNGGMLASNTGDVSDGRAAPEQRPFARMRRVGNGSMYGSSSGASKQTRLCIHMNTYVHF